MRKLITLGTTFIGSSIGWWLGAFIGTMTAFLLSIVGLGVGGSAEYAMLLAKRSLTRKIGEPNPDAEEAEFARSLLVDARDPAPVTVLELGAGGGNNASHLKAHFKMTLVDLSEGMIELSRKLNPECEHIPGDMKTLRLGRAFDAVFIHDAIMYMTNEDDLRLEEETAFVNCMPGGAAVF